MKIEIGDLEIIIKRVQGSTVEAKVVVQVHLEIEIEETREEAQVQV